MFLFLVLCKSRDNIRKVILRGSGKVYSSVHVFQDFMEGICVVACVRKFRTLSPSHKFCGCI